MKNVMLIVIFLMGLLIILVLMLGFRVSLGPLFMNEPILSEAQDIKREVYLFDFFTDIPHRFITYSLPLTAKESSILDFYSLYYSDRGWSINDGLVPDSLCFGNNDESVTVVVKNNTQLMKEGHMQKPQYKVVQIFHYIINFCR